MKKKIKSFKPSAHYQINSPEWFMARCQEKVFAYCPTEKRWQAVRK